MLQELIDELKEKITDAEDRVSIKESLVRVLEVVLTVDL
jgi:hypothetical protein